MSVVNDILLDDNLDLAAQDGDFAVGDATNQHQKLLLLGEKNDFKQFPGACVGAFNAIDDEDDSTDLCRDIRIKFAADGMTVNKVNYKNGVINIDANYE